jgi:hypothetical protein
MSSILPARGTADRALGVFEIRAAILQHLADIDDRRTLFPAALVCRDWFVSATDILWCKPPLRALYAVPAHRRALYTAAVRPLLIPPSQPLPLLQDGAFLRLREIVVPFHILRDSAPERLQDILERSSRASNRVISSVVIPATARRHYTRSKAAATAQLHLETPLALARHPGLTKLVIARLDRQSLDRAKATSVTMTTTTTTTMGNHRLFASLRLLETSMLADAARPLVALLNGPRQSPHTIGERQQPPHGAILTSLHVTILDDATYMARCDGTCSIITPVVRAFGHLRSLRVLDIRFAVILCPFTAQHLAQLKQLADLRELSITFGAIAN